MTRAAILLVAGLSRVRLRFRPARGRSSAVAAWAFLLVLPAAPSAEALDLILVEPDQVATSRELYLQWTFGSARVANSHQATAEARLRDELDFMERSCGLTAAQRAKLDVAGRGDIHRFFSRVDGFIAGLPTGPIAPEEVSAIRLRLRPFTLRYQSCLHGRSSLLRKTLRTTLDARQLAACDVALAARREEQYRAHIAGLLEGLSRNNRLQMSAEQKRRVSDLLVEHAGPPDFGAGGSFSSYYVYHALSVVPEQELRTIVGEPNWPTISQYVQAGRTYAPILKAVEDDEFETVGHLATR